MANLFDWNHIAETAPTTPARHFGNPRQELEAARSGTVICPLSHFALLSFSGQDAQAFLQGQFTCDLRQVTPSTAQYGGYCTPKGRLLADFLLFLTPQAYFMHLPAELSSPIADRLRKFVLRSKVKVETDTGLRAIGLGGPGAAGLLRQSIGEPPRLPLEVVNYPNAMLLRLTGDSFLVVAPLAQIAGLWDSLVRQATPAGTDAWDWLQIQAGIPWITKATQEEFVPQMVGLEAIGGVSFEKGCYPGQEIVARTHYLGEIKRRLRFGHTADLAGAGDALVAEDQTVGMVVNTAPAPDGGSDLLAVVQTGIDSGAVRLRTPDGAAVKLSSLPFAEAPSAH